MQDTEFALPQVRLSGRSTPRGAQAASGKRPLKACTHARACGGDPRCMGGGRQPLLSSDVTRAGGTDTVHCPRLSQDRNTRNRTFLAASLDPGSRQQIPVKWHGTGACHGVFIPDT